MQLLTGADPEKYSLGGKRVAWRLEGVEEMEIELQIITHINICLDKPPNADILIIIKKNLMVALEINKLFYLNIKTSI